MAPPRIQAPRLIEVAIVLSTLAVLAYIALPVQLRFKVEPCRGQMQKAKAKRTIADIRNVAAALDCYKRKHGSYPSGGWAEASASLVAEGYIQAAPPTDAWKRPYLYASAADTYALGSLGCDGVADGQTAEPGESLFGRDIVAVGGKWAGPVPAWGPPFEAEIACWQ